MRVIEARNVHAALPLGLNLLSEIGIPMPSRAGNVITSPVPVTTVYQRPTERVLFYPERDANPFFHMFEGLWMLAGRNDLKFLTDFVKRFEQFSNDGVTVSGAYGYRWRRHWREGVVAPGGHAEAQPIDQIERVVKLLTDQPFSRRGVLTMFDPVEDLRTDESNKDVCCNLSVMFMVGYGRRDEPNRLHMTVPCRSNDIIWGAYGANAVHFSMLQEYMAARLGLAVGNYYQVSNNFHAYEDIFNKTRRGVLAADPGVNPYEAGEVTSYPMAQNPKTWDRDLALFFEDPTSNGFDNPFFAQVVKPLWWSHSAAKKHQYVNALEIIEQCQASDWRRAGEEWLQRRKVVWQAKKKKELAAKAQVAE